MATVFEIALANRVNDWRNAGVSENDIQLALKSGMDGRDVRALREFAGKGFLIVVRCPKATAALWHGVLPPKRAATKEKTNDAGVVESARKSTGAFVPPRRTGAFESPRRGSGVFESPAKTTLMVSDYDLMSVWRRDESRWAKVFMSAQGGADRGPLGPEASALIRELNRILVSPIQHGCQDDYQSPKNRGVKAGDYFAAFAPGVADYLPSPTACADFYLKHGLAWPYDPSGKYNGPGAA